jgi:hypothetical protein
MDWKTFGPGLVEGITDVAPDAVRMMRLRGRLTPAPEHSRQKFNGVLLAEVLLAGELGRYDATGVLTTTTARALGSSWIAFHALRAQGLSDADAAKMTGRKLPAAIYMLSHIGDEEHWRKTVFTHDIADALANDKQPLAIVVNLQRLGAHLSQRAGTLTIEGVDE